MIVGTGFILCDSFTSFQVFFLEVANTDSWMLRRFPLSSSSKLNPSMFKIWVTWKIENIYIKGFANFVFSFLSFLFSFFKCISTSTSKKVLSRGTEHEHEKSVFSGNWDHSALARLSRRYRQGKVLYNIYTTLLLSQSIKYLKTEPVYMWPPILGNRFLRKSVIVNIIRSHQ